MPHTPTMDHKFLEDYKSPECQGVRLVCNRCGFFRALARQEVETAMGYMDDELPFTCDKIQRLCHVGDTVKNDPLLAAFHRLCDRYAFATAEGVDSRLTACLDFESTEPVSNLRVTNFVWKGFPLAHTCCMHRWCMLVGHTRSKISTLSRASLT